jgi:NAD-dependent deacetylase
MEIPEEIISKLRCAKRVMVFTGAGVSAESGIPTFRDALNGLWEKFKAEELDNINAFKNNPSLVWGWYEWRRMQILQARPNPAHLAIAALVNLVPRLTLVTQNVDDLHERAGNLDVIHLHGRINKPFCFACKRPYIFLPGIPDEPEGGRHLAPPRCKCGGMIRPGVVWSGESLPEIDWDAANDAAYHCDVFLCIGTSSSVKPAAKLPYIAFQRGATVIQVNPNSTALDGFSHLNLQGAAGEVLPYLFEKVWGSAFVQALLN